MIKMFWVCRHVLTQTSLSATFSDCILTVVMKTLAASGGSVQQADVQEHFPTGINLTVLTKYLYA